MTNVLWSNYDQYISDGQKSILLNFVEKEKSAIALRKLPKVVVKSKRNIKIDSL